MDSLVELQQRVSDLKARQPAMQTGIVETGRWMIETAEVLIALAEMVQRER